VSRLATRTSRLRQLERVLLLAPQGLAASELATRLDVNRRTVYRDLDFLSDQGVPLWQHAGRFGINRSSYLPAIRLSYHEAVALVLAGLLLARTIDEHNPHVVTALRKLAVALPGSLTPHLERAASRVQAHGDSRQGISILEALAEGWGNNRKVRVGYRSPRSGSLRERVVAPYALEPTASGIYVIGHDDWADDVRTFKLNRLEWAAVLEESFEMPADFDPEAHLATSWRIMSGEGTTEVLLRFSAAATPHVREQRWHPSQRLEAAAGGGCLLRLQVAEPLEMQPWIRSWGGQVEVLEPEWLRAQIADELSAAAAQYTVGARENDHPAVDEQDFGG
jgi:predicted DNA-binding transcriptional regulator YafY